MSTTPQPRRQNVQVTVPQIPGYRIIGKLGQGGMGVVYKAIQNSMNRAVAIKVLHPNKSQSDESIERFQREIQVLAQLSHPNIVVAIDTGRVGDSLYYVMELIEGQTALDLLKNGPLPENRVLDITLQIARALAHAHKHKLVHRDIKPENIIVTDEGVAKLLDLGIARSLEENVDHTITSQGMMVGTPAYISPEQAFGEKADIRSDIYSLGITAYQLSTGDVPFHADTTANLIRMHISRPPEAPIKRNPALTQAFNQLVLRMLEKDPKDRFQTPQELIAALEKVQLQNATRGAAPRRGKAVVVRESSWSGMQKALVVLIVLLALVILGYYGLGMLKKPAPAPPPVVNTKPPPPVEKPPEEKPPKEKPPVDDMRTSVLKLWLRLEPALKSRSQDAETQDLLASWAGILKSAHDDDPAIATEFLEKSRSQMAALLDPPALEEIRALAADRSRWTSSRPRATELQQVLAYVRWVKTRAPQIVPQEDKALDEAAAALNNILGFKGSFRLLVNVFPSDARVAGLTHSGKDLAASLKPDDLWMPFGQTDLEIGDWLLQIKQGNTVREVRLDPSRIKPGGRVHVYGSMDEAALRVKYD